MQRTWISRRAESQLSSAARSAAPWIERLARFGYGSKAVVYCLIGFLTLRAALGSRGEITGTHGVFATLLSQPFGRILLALIAAGLVGYALWRFVQAFADADGKGSNTKGLLVRAGFAGSGVIHSLVALEAARMSFYRTRAGGGNPYPGWAATTMEKPAGTLLVMLAGVGLIAYGAYHFYKACKTKLGRRLDLSRLNTTTRTFVVRASRLGLAARGVAFIVIGTFLIRAGRQKDPSEARGLEGALHALESAPYGKWVLSLVAVGLIGYGVYQFLNARYRRIAA